MSLLLLFWRHCASISLLVLDMPLVMHSCAGRHAAGKSSVVSLVMRYYDATQGQVCFTYCTTIGIM
jgi:ABC-type ATPase involved in cell division